MADRVQSEPHLLSEAVRHSLGRQIVEDLIDDKKELHCISIEAQTERRLREGIHRDPEEGFVLALHPDFQDPLHNSLVAEYQKASKEGYIPVFLCSSTVRAGLFHVLQRILAASKFSVLSHEEIPRDINIKIIGQVETETQLPATLGT